MRWAALCVVALLAVGCKQPNIPIPEEQEITKRKENEEKKTKTRFFNSDGGSFTVYDQEKRLKRWTVHWKSAQLEYSPDGNQVGGKMESVTGILYDKGKEGSTFEAGAAFVEKGSTILNLGGGVVVKSALPNGSMRCNKISYESEKGIVDAVGEIEVRQFGYVFSGVEHVKAKTNLSVVATPDLFE